MRFLLAVVLMMIGLTASAAPPPAQTGSSCSMKAPDENRPLRDGNRCYRDVLAVQRIDMVGSGEGRIRWPVYEVKRRYVKCLDGKK